MTRAVTEEMFAAADFEYGKHSDEPWSETALRYALRAALAAMPPSQEAGPVAGDLVSREAAIEIVGTIAESSQFAPGWMVLESAAAKLHALPAARQWRPMDSAPKDRIILLACRGSSYAVLGLWLGKVWYGWGRLRELEPYAWTEADVPPAPLSVEEGTGNG